MAIDPEAREQVEDRAREPAQPGSGSRHAAVPLRAFISYLNLGFKSRPRRGRRPSLPRFFRRLVAAWSMTLLHSSAAKLAGCGD